VNSQIIHVQDDWSFAYLPAQLVQERYELFAVDRLLKELVVEHVKILGNHAQKCCRLHVELGRVDSDMCVDARILPLQVSTRGEHALVKVEHSCPRLLMRTHDLSRLIDLPFNLL
jgi:hypothetical protein